MSESITKFICEDCSKEIEIITLSPLLMKKCGECWLKYHRKKDK